MLTFVERRKKDYSRHNILKRELAALQLNSALYLLLPFSKKKFLSLWLRGKTVINDFFISDYDTYANDRKKGSRYNLSASYKYILDWINFRLSPYLLSDTQAHFDHWQQLFGQYRGQHLVFPVLADNLIYRPSNASKKENATAKILFYGYFIPLHGIDIILKALHICEQKGFAFEASFIGKGQTLADMLLLAEQLNLKQVKFNREFIAESELAKEICQSDIVLGIFGDSEKAHSVVPNKVYQALACGSAVITQDSPAIREFFTDQDLCMVERDPELLAEAIENLLNHPDQRRQLANNGNSAYQRLYQTSIAQLNAFITAIDRKANDRG